jgi:hypothetical protein
MTQMFISFISLEISQHVPGINYAHPQENRLHRTMSAADACNMGKNNL